MHNLVSRVSKVSSNFTSWLAYLVLALAFLSYVQNTVGGAAPTGTLAVTDVRASMRTSLRAGSLNNKPKENMKFKFDLDTDLTGLFNWNTKQVFVYITVDYEGDREDIHNSAVIWDKIITEKDAAKLNLKGQRGKYNIWDVSDTFKGRDARVVLRYDVQPQIGFVRHGEVNLGSDVHLKFPTSDDSQK